MGGGRTVLGTWSAATDAQDGSDRSLRRLYVSLDRDFGPGQQSTAGQPELKGECSVRDLLWEDYLLLLNIAADEQKGTPLPIYYKKKAYET